MADADMIAGLDIGASSIGCAIGRIDERKQVNVIGIGCSPPLGMENGTVADLPLLTSSIEKAINEAEEIAGVGVEKLFVGVGQTNFRGIKGRGVVSIPSAGREINNRDVNRVIEVARLVAVRSNVEPIDEMVQEFIVDGQGGIKNPIGMYGYKLEAEVYLVTGNLSTFTVTIMESIKNAGYQVEGLTLEPLAAAEAVLTRTEKKLGVLLIDLGGESTSVAVFVNNNVVGARVLAVGANQITTDIASKFHLTMAMAEQIKREHGHAVAASVRENEQIDIPLEERATTKRIPRSSLAHLIQTRLDSIFSLVRREIEDTRFPRGLGESVVLTGGGALLEGATELAHQKFALPVRMGRPDFKIEGWGKVANSPAYSALFGLLTAGLSRRQLKMVKGPAWQTPLSKIRKFFKELF